MNVIAVIGKFDRLPARATAPLAFGRTFRATGCKQLKLLEAAQQFGSEEGVTQNVSSPFCASNVLSSVRQENTRSASLDFGQGFLGQRFPTNLLQTSPDCSEMKLPTPLPR